MSDKFLFEETPFYFLRHGETFDSTRGILQGQRETELNGVGRKTAEEAADRLVGTNLRSIYASPLKRAWQTASIVSVLTGAPAHAEPGLMERKWGIFEGRPKSERPAFEGHPTVETIDSFSVRILDAMQSISGPTPLLVVAHSGVFRILARHAGFPIDDSITITSGHLLRFEPPSNERSRWRITEM
jgi:probable phosphoglycerate mutase